MMLRPNSNIKAFFLSACIALFGCSQPEKQYDNVVYIDSVTSIEVSLHEPPPTDPDLWITNAPFVNEVMDGLADIDSLSAANSLSGNLYVLARTDSFLIFENSTDRIAFERDENKWTLQSADIKSSGFAIGGVRTGMHSRGVFQSLKSRVTKSIGDNQILVGDGNPEGARVRLLFSNDSLVSVRID